MTVLDDGLPPADDELDYENTYIMTPEGYGPNQRFESAKVKLVIEDILKEALDNGLEYDPSKAGQKAKELCEQVKEQAEVPDEEFGFECGNFGWRFLPLTNLIKV